jgi:hypothetical protein
VIAYGLHIGTRVEMSTLSETNNAQFFSEPESRAFYRDSNSGIYEPPIILSSYPWFTNLQRPLAGAETLLKTGEPDEPEFLDPWSQQM